jgi:hypothetical protein
METTLSLVKGKEHYQGIQHVLIPLEKDMKKALSKINRLVIKINLVVKKTPRRPQGVDIAVTPVEAVRSFIDCISPFYNDPIYEATARHADIWRRGSNAQPQGP